MREARAEAERTETHPVLPDGGEERFSGYGVMGLPFRSGHVLAMRRFAASSLGSGYTSVWHRAPSGDWTFYQDVAPEHACPRFFGPRLRRSLVAPLELRWESADTFRVRIDDGRELDWSATVAAPASIRAMNAMAALMPAAAWRNELVLRTMGVMARGLLGTGQLALTGLAPSGQRFAANPLIAWMISSSTARVRGEDIGEPGPLAEQERLGDFWIPQRGLFVVGRAFFEPHDPARHVLDVHAAG